MQFGFERCPYCGNVSGFIYIHGHYQCKRCHQNVMPCCGGEQNDEIILPTPKNVNSDPSDEDAEFLLHRS